MPADLMRVHHHGEDHRKDQCQNLLGKTLVGKTSVARTVRRREVVTLLGGMAGVMAAWPLAARGQEGSRIRRIAALFPFAEGDPDGQRALEAFRRGLQELGWTENLNIHIDVRWGGGNVERTRAYADELVALSPDVIFAYFNAQLAPLSRATRTIPIVFVGASDPVGAGYVASLARPGGNITGFTLYEPSLAGKWLDILKEIAPAVARVGLMVNPDTAILHGTFYAKTFASACAKLSVEPITMKVHSPADIEAAVQSLGKQPKGGLIVAPDTFSETYGELIVSLAAQYGVPTVYAIPRFAAKGGLASYGADVSDTERRAASYVARILRGDNPAELPVQAPVKFSLLINTKAAKALGLDIPPMLLAQADQVIE
jgi:putative ABC transport system substrate-binding protein